MVDEGRQFSRDDLLATEEPLEIRLAAGERVQAVATTMRTPGSDFELAAGFLYGEGVVSDRHAIRRIGYCTDAPQTYNSVTVALAGEQLPELSSVERRGTVTSACGVCGKASLDALHLRGLKPLPPDGVTVDLETLFRLPAALRAAQRHFSRTGGLHGAGLFTAGGDAIVVREDVGRHNAVDKVVGWAVLKGHLPLTETLLVVSGRAGFEIVQKAVAARVPVVCAVSAPSSLAVDVAAEFGITLVGFLRGRRANVYAGGERLLCGGTAGG